MAALVKVWKDEVTETILFANEEMAQKFINFVQLYTDEVGPSNSYEVYAGLSVDPTVITETDLESGDEDYVRILDYDRLERMGYEIAKVRSLGTGVIVTPTFTHGSFNGAAVFDFGGLVQRQVPAVGDMYRLVDRSKEPDGYSDSFDEGRVLSIWDGYAIVRGYANEYQNQTISTCKLPLSALMKIDDYLTGLVR
jgi:hypothetical protein